MNKQAPPSTSAGAGAPPELSADVPTPKPASPATGDVVGALLAGLPTLVFTTMVASALAVAFAGSFVPRPHVGVTLLFAVIPGIGLAVFVRRWALTLRVLVLDAAHEVRWPFLLVPFFVVLGVAAGFAFANAVVLGIDPTGEIAVRMHCDAVVPASAPSERERCKAGGAECASTLLASGDAELDALHACITARLASPFAPLDRSATRTPPR